MFDHTIAVIAHISRSLKKYLNISSVVTQLLFMSYYVYLIVVNVDKTQFLILYSALEVFAFGILIVDVVSIIRDLDRRGKRIKARTKRIINYFSWAAKLAVIIFNIVLNVQGGVTEAGKMFLIFSGVFLLLQILLTITSTLFSYYLDLLLFSVKMDYEALVDSEEPHKRPVGKILHSVTKDMDYRDNVNESCIKYEVSSAIKKELAKDTPLKINGKIVKRKKAERIILHYYAKAHKYYASHHRLTRLLESLKKQHITYLTSDDHLYVLLFFANNHLTRNFKGLSEYALKLVIATLLFIDDGNDRGMVELAYKAISKELLDVYNWSKVIKAPKSYDEYHRVIMIVKETKLEKKRNRDESIASEFRDITIQEVEKQMDLPRPVSKVLHHIIDRKKRQ